MTQFTEGSTPGVAIAYRVLGKDVSGRYPLLMIQGLSGTKEDWQELATTLSNERLIIVMDNRCIGESTIYEEKFTLRDMAADALKVLDACNVQVCHVVGISMGGMITQELALLAPSRFASVTLGCTHHGGPNQLPANPEFRDAFRAQPNLKGKRAIVENLTRFNVTPEWRARHPNEWNRMIDISLACRRPQKGIFRQILAIMSFDVADRISSIKVPVLIIHGDKDDVLDVGNGAMIRDKIPNSQLHIMPGVGHVFWVMEPEHSAKLISGFVRGVEMPPTSHL
eukprot:TRINITY_DN106181_c0_g1_i1.p1 TRINITY_DN106181_c0_g1~~TRINITY_DN106181_c0_g1_i1.p1  ORF type:complete len:282 (+),score=22.09 TRINITY_DN106181_c0_g1_i1:20-865(+)